MKIKLPTKTPKKLFVLILILQSIGLYAWQLQPDLIVVESALYNSLRIDSTFNNDNCFIEEGCLAGTGMRELLKFTTQIANIGDGDFFVGQPPQQDDMSNDTWQYAACHSHYHYDSYAEYVLLDEQDNVIPAGFKTGFCLMDSNCDPGYVRKYTSCVGDQGISAHCSDIYGDLACQWIDITGLPEGLYKLRIRVNYQEEPDFNGVYESTYQNNSAEVCFELFRTASGRPYIYKPPFGTGCTSVDCLETTLTIQFDGFAHENSWQLYSNNILLYSSGGPYNTTFSNTTLSEVFCLPVDCYVLTFWDTSHDGICCQAGNGNYKIINSSGLVLVNESPQNGPYTVSQFCITAPNPCNDLDSDGICAENDCNDNDAAVPAPPGAACNDNNPNTIHDEIQPDGCACAGIIDNNCTIEMSLFLQFDNFPFETSWEILNTNGDIVDLKPEYQGYAGYSSTSENICLVSGCYTLVMKDTFGDGMCCNAGNGFYRLTNNFNEVVAEGSTFDNTVSHSFCVAPCESDLYIGSLNNTTTTYKVSNSISGVGAVTGNNTDVTFSALQRVELKTGFKVQSGSTFRADNEGCGN